MNTIFTVLGTMGSVFAVVMTALSMINYRKPRKITLVSTFLSGLISVLSLGIMVWLGGMQLAYYLSYPLFMAGLTLGYLRGAAVKLSWENGQVIGRNSILFLILWGLSLALSQLLGLFGSPLLASLGLIPVFFTTGLQAGLFSQLFLRRLLMGKKGKDRKGLQTVFSIAGGIFLLLITILIFSVAIPEWIEWDSRASSASAYGPSLTDAIASDQEAASSGSTSPLTPGELPASGKLIFNCDEELERQKEYSLIRYNFGSNYSFEEAFTDYQISLDMELDFSVRSFQLNQHQIESWSDIKWGGSADDTIMIVEISTEGEGILNEEGWISGIWHHYSSYLDDPDAEPYESSAEFYGYIDDQMEEVVACFLKPKDASADEIRPNEYTADFDALQSAGKDQLISSWYHSNGCYICTIEGVKP